MTDEGGEHNAGTVFTSDQSGNNHSVTKELFRNSGASSGHGQLCVAANGKLYGATVEGGFYDLGVLYEYNPSTNSYRKIIDFDGVDLGAAPHNTMIQASNGKLYGLTSAGGANNLGTLFEYDPATDTFTKKVDFAGTTNGRQPRSALAEASNGKVYGVTLYGGVYDQGVLFEYDPQTGGFSKKVDFGTVNTGNAPSSKLVDNGNGVFYGTASLGGLYSAGVLYEYHPLIDSFSKRHDFVNNLLGRRPYGDLVIISASKLYGIANVGGTGAYGVLYEYDLSTNTYTKKVNFNGSGNGGTAHGGLFRAANGKIYGLTGTGGANNDGVFYAYDPVAGAYSKILDFDKTIQGSGPVGCVVQTTSGQLYGTTQYNGICGVGVLFEFVYTTNVFTIKLDFNGAPQGSHPAAGLIQARNGKLYGMTNRGGSKNCGVLFDFDTATHVFTRRIDFIRETHGRNPVGSLVLINTGRLYGMTEFGGTLDRGVIFEFNPITNAFVKKFDFDGTNGSYPLGSLMLANNGKLYGLTRLGGTNNTGTLFEFDPANGSFTKLHDFTVSFSNPVGSLIQASNGKLYGINSKSHGEVFEFDLATNVYSSLAYFSGILNGGSPEGGLTESINGKLYGVTYIGGNNDLGALYEFDPSGNTITNKHDFDGAVTGSNPYGKLMEASNGKLYGMTKTGGAYGFGVLFEFDPSTDSFVVKLEYEGTNGGSPTGNLIELCIAPVVSAPSDVTTCDHYILPGISSGSYFSASGGIGTSYYAGDTIKSSQTVFVYGANGKCSDEDSFEVTIINTPQSQIPNNDTVCSFYILPNLPGGNYYSGPNGIGNLLQAGDSIYTTQRIYIYAANGICVFEDSFDITVIPNPIKDFPDDLIACDWFILPGLTTGEYYSESGGAGDLLQAGDTITTSRFVYIFATEGKCSFEHPFVIDIIHNPFIGLPSVAEVCDMFILPELAGFGNYYTGTSGGGSVLYTGDTIKSSQVIYRYADSGTCVFEKTFEIIIKQTPLNTVTMDSGVLTSDDINATYQWLNCAKNFALISGETKQTFSPKKNGEYAVEVSRSACIDTSICISFQKVVMGTAPPESLFEVFPNPTSGFLTLRTDADFDDWTIIIRNSLGQVIMRADLPAAREQSIYLDGKPGIYFIEIRQNSGNKVVKVLKE